MKIAIIGAGFAGLEASRKLAKKGHSVTVIEREAIPGGLAIGFISQKWDWPLEKHYHHLFTSDKHIIEVSSELNHKIVFRRPKTSTWIGGEIAQLDSVASLLSFKMLSPLSRIRTGIGLALMRFNPIWKPFELFTAQKYIQIIMGIESWTKLWEPLFVAKFSSFYENISAAWFWSRIFKRSPNLGYPDGGFENLAKLFEKDAISSGARFIYNAQVREIQPMKNSKIRLDIDGKHHVFDKVISTLPTPMLLKITKGFTEEFITKYSSLAGIGAVNLVLSLKKQFLTDGSYWLNINDRSMPFLAVVEHTNMIDKKNYAGDHILYVGNYLSASHPYFGFTADKLITLFLPHLKKINPRFSRSWVKESWVWKAPFAQPIVTPHYSKKIPPIITPINNLYIANIQQVYPWDRGTTYAVELGDRVSKLI